MHGKTPCVELQTEGAFPPAVVEYLSKSIIP